MDNILWSGLGYGILCIIFFGLYATPRRYTYSPSLEFLLTMCITVAICTSITGVFFPGWLAISLSQIALSYLSGLLWCMGTVCYIYSVDCVGIGRATPVKNLTVILAVVFGVFIFKEFSWQNKLPLTLLGGATALVLLSTILLGKLIPVTELARESCPIHLIKPKLKKVSQYSMVGFGFALGAALFYSLFGIPGKLVIESMDSVWPYFLFMGQGTLGGALACYFIIGKDRGWTKVSPKDHLLAMLSGLLWVVAFASLANTLKLLGMAVAWPIANLNAIVTVLYSALVLKEISISQQRTKMFAGLIIGVMGIILLALART
ncbi:MAG: GRP family sugar transporter [bacterium]